MHPKSPNPSYLVNVNLICCYMRVFCTQLPYDRPYKLACTSKCTITLIIFHDVLIQLKQKKETNNELTGATPSSSEIKYRWQRIIYSLNLKNKKLWAKQIFFFESSKETKHWKWLHYEYTFNFAKWAIELFPWLDD